MKKTKMELNYSAIATELSLLSQEAIALLPDNGSQPTQFKLEEKTQLGTLVSNLREAGQGIAVAYVLDYGFRFLELEEICVFLPIKDDEGNQEVRDRLKMNLVGTFSFSLDRIWCYYSLTKKAYLDRRRSPLEFALPCILPNLL